MNKEIMKKAGFGDEVTMVKYKKCPLCKTSIEAEFFRDELSIKEYHISGMCQSCQDDVFGGEDDTESI